MVFTFVPAGDIEEFFREAFKETTDRHDVEILPPPEG